MFIMKYSPGHLQIGEKLKKTYYHKFIESLMISRVTIWSKSEFLWRRIFSRVLRDSTPRFVGPSVRPSVDPSVRLHATGLAVYLALF